MNQLARGKAKTAAIGEGIHRSKVILLAEGDKKKEIHRKNRKRKMAEETILEYHFHHIPRILKNDLRRQYPIMFSNVYNAANFDYMRKYLESFYNPDFKLILEKYEFGMLQRKEFVGYDACGTEWFERMNDAEDLIFSLKNVQFKARSDGTSAAIGYFEIRGTRILKIDARRLPEGFNPNILLDQQVSVSKVLAQISSQEPVTAVLKLPTADLSLKYHEIALFEDPEFVDAFNEYISSESSVSSEQQVTNKSTATASQEPPIPNPLGNYQLSNQVTENELLVFYQAFDESMNLYRQNHVSKSMEPVVPVAFPFCFYGEVTNYIDIDSKVSTTHFRIFVN